MIVVYDSLTGNTKKAAEKLGMKTKKINSYENDDDKKIFLMTRSQGFGEVPKTTLEFLNKYSKRVVGVAVSGNKNWGKNFGKAGRIIESKYNIPLVCIFEGIGFDQEIKKIKEFLLRSI